MLLRRCGTSVATNIKPYEAAMVIAGAVVSGVSIYLIEALYTLNSPTVVAFKFGSSVIRAAMFKGLLIIFTYFLLLLLLSS